MNSKKDSNVFNGNLIKSFEEIFDKKAKKKKNAIRSIILVISKN